MGKEIKTVKRTADCYVIRKPMFCWAVIMIDEASGTLSINSDYGAYGHSWGSHGCKSLKEFFTSAGHYDYFKNKLSYGLPKWFDTEATLNEIKSKAKEMRRVEDLTKEEAREVWREIELLEEEGGNDATSFQHYLFNETTLFSTLYNDDYHAVPSITGYSPQLEAFFVEIWPEFVAMLKEELNETSPITA